MPIITYTILVVEGFKHRPLNYTAIHLTTPLYYLPQLAFFQVSLLAPSTKPHTYHPPCQLLCGASVWSIPQGSGPTGLGSRSTCFPCWSSSLSLVRILQALHRRVTTPDCLAAQAVGRTGLWTQEVTAAATLMLGRDAQEPLSPPARVCSQPEEGLLGACSACLPPLPSPPPLWWLFIERQTWNALGGKTQIYFPHGLQLAGL